MRSKNIDEIWQLPIEDREKGKRRLYMKWHPDKNLDNPDFAEEVFKFIQQQWDKLESGNVTSTSSTFYSWRRYQHEWNNTAREQRYYQNQYQEYSSQRRNESSGHGGGGGHMHSGGGHYFGSGFFCGSFTPPPVHREAQWWIRQAVADSKALENLYQGYKMMLICPAMYASWHMKWPRNP